MYNSISDRKNQLFLSLIGFVYKVDKYSFRILISGVLLRSRNAGSIWRAGIATFPTKLFKPYLPVIGQATCGSWNR